MVILLRILRVALSAGLGIAVFSGLFEFVSALLRAPGVPGAPGVRWMALSWGVFFRTPGYLFFGAPPVLIVLALMELRGAQRLWLYLLLWMGAGLLLGREDWLAAAISGAAVGFCYWWLAGRTAGNWIGRWRERRLRPGIKPGIYLAYAVLAYLAFQTVGYGYYGAKLLWVSYVSEPGPGTPPVAFGQLTAPRKVALMDFPDVASCLTKDADVALPNYLERMDWDRIDNASEAEVCTFRLLASYEDLSHATKWFEVQGFKVSDGFGSAKPIVAPDGTLLVHGGIPFKRMGRSFRREESSGGRSCQPPTA